MSGPLTTRSTPAARTPAGILEISRWYAPGRAHGAGVLDSGAVVLALPSKNRMHVAPTFAPKPFGSLIPMPGMPGEGDTATA